MQRRFFTHWIVLGLIGLGWMSEANAQTITTSTLAVTKVCGSDNLSVPFTTTGAFAATNAFSVELSDAAGSFATPRALTPTGAASPLSVSIPANVPEGTGYRVRVVSSAPVVVGSTSATVLSIGRTPAAPVVATTAYNYCVGATAMPLAATPTAGNSLQWYNDAGNSIAAAPTPGTTTAGTQSYSVSQVSAGGCESAKVAITVVVSGAPTAPAAPSPVEICEGSAATPLTATGNNLKWFTAAGAALPGAPTPSNTASSSYQVSQTVNGCESPKTTVSVTIKPKPAAPTVNAAQTFCQNSTIAPLTATGSALKWYDANENPLPGAPTPSNTANSSFKVSQTVGGCESDQATITVTITKTPVPTVAGDVEYCAGATATALTATGTDLKWYAAASGGAALASAPTPATATAGVTDYFVSQTAGGCESDRARIRVMVKAIPAAPSVSTAGFCVGEPSSALTATGNNLLWYAAETGGTGNGTAPSPNTATAGSFSFYVSQTVNGCESPRAKLDVTVKAVPGAPATTASLTYCYEATVPVLTATGSGLKWYDANDRILPNAPTPSNTTSSTYKVSQTVDGCESAKATISVTINRTPVPTATNVDYCAGATATALAATGTGLKWYVASSGGAALANAPTPVTTTAGVTSYYVSQTLNGCESERTKVTVTVKPVPVPPTVTALSVCEGSPASVLTATGTSLRWYTAATGGTGSSTAPSTNTGTVGTTAFYVTQTTNGCESTRAKLDVIIKDSPAAPVVTADVPYCAGTTATALSATGTELKWFDASNNPLASAPVPSTANPGSTTYKVSQTKVGCESPKASIVVTVYRTAAPAVTNTVEYCNNESPVALTATGTALRFYNNAAGGTGATAVPVPSTAAVGTTTYYVSQTQNNCESDRSRIDVIVKAIPAIPTVAAPAPVCQFATIPTLVASVGGISGTLRWYDNATGGNGSASVPRPSANNSGTTTYYVTQTVNGCESPRIALSQEIKAQPAIPAVTPNVDICAQAGSSPLTASGTNLKWYTVDSGGNASTAAPTPPTNAVGTTAYFVSQTTVYSADLACEGPRAKIDVTINPLPGLPSVTSQVVCQERQDKPLNFSASGENLKWYPSAAGGSAVGNTPSLNLKEPQEKSFFVSQTTGKGCEGSRAEVKIRVKPLPGLPGVTPLIVYCQFDNPQRLAADPVDNGTINWYGTNASGGNRTDAPTPSTASGGDTDFYVSQTLEGCEGDRTPIKVRINTTPRPGVTTPIEYCQNVTAQPLSAQGSQLKWYREENSKDSQATPFTPFTANVGNSAFYVTQTGTNNCESPKQKIDVRIKPLPSATITGDQSIPLGGSAEITINFTGDGPWNYRLSNQVAGTGETQNPLKDCGEPPHDDDLHRHGSSQRMRQGYPQWQCTDHGTRPDGKHRQPHHRQPVRRYFVHGTVSAVGYFCEEQQIQRAAIPFAGYHQFPHHPDGSEGKRRPGDDPRLVAGRQLLRARGGRKSAVHHCGQHQPRAGDRKA